MRFIFFAFSTLTKNLFSSVLMYIFRSTADLSRNLIYDVLKQIIPLLRDKRTIFWGKTYANIVM